MANALGPSADVSAHRFAQAEAVDGSGAVLHSAWRREAGPPGRQQLCGQCQCATKRGRQPDMGVHYVATAHTWTYPSEQMFFNAMRRKGWVPREDDMPRWVVHRVYTSSVVRCAR